MSAVWSTLETHVVNGAFPLQRCVGSTDHSGVFLTQATKHAPSAVALKLIPFEPESSQAQLARWRAAIELSHPHLLRMFEVGECRVAGLRYLFARMEYADQTLAQLLERRALTEVETRDMLGPVLGALDYLHRANFVHGGLKPSNVLVVGTQLKLASDTLRASGEAPADASPADDVRALGVTLCEALTRRRPSGLEGAGEVELPAELPDSLRQVVSRCLSRNPADRPTVAQLQAWLGGGPEPPVSAPAQPTRLVIRVELPPEPEAGIAAAPERGRWRVLPLAIAAVVLVALGWAGYRLYSRSPGQAVVRESPPRTDVPARVAAPPPAAPVEPPAARPAASPDTPVHEELPVISRSSLETIHGTIKVSVRVTVDGNGVVTAVTAEDPGPSRFFERRALEAAKKWTFAPVTASEPRSLRIRFEFTRSGVTASVTPRR